MNIAFFDFDGTITSKDSMVDFIIYSYGYKRFISGMIQLIPYLIMYKLKIIQNWEAKEKVLQFFFRGLSSNDFIKISSEYSKKRLHEIIREKALSAINEHRNNRDKIVIVSASIDSWLKPWCDLQSVNLICTRLEIKNNLITGKIRGKNCYGIEKLNQIKAVYNLSQYDTIFAYGDSKGDIEMLSLADVKYYKWRKI